MSSKRDLKKGINGDAMRGRRTETAVQLRKDKKEDSISKRRNMNTAVVNNFVNEAGDGSSMAEHSDAAGGSKTFSTSDIPELMQGLSARDNVAMQIKSLRGFRRLLSVERNPPVQQTIDIGAVPLFVEFLQRNDCMELQFEAAWALTNIASTDRTRLVVDCGAIPHLVALLLSESADIREQSAWCLGNVAGDGADLRDIVMNAGALPPLVQNLMQPANATLLRNCTWSLSNFCRGKPKPNIRAIAGALPVLGEIIKNCDDKEAVTDAAWALSYVSDGDDTRIQHVVDLGVVPALITMMQDQQVTVVVPALRTLGNIASGNDDYTAEVVRCNVLPTLVPLLAHPKRNIRKETCWMLSNIAAGTETMLDDLFTTPHLIARVLEQFGTSAEWEVRKEAAWVVSNIASAGKPKHIHNLVEQGAIRPLCDMLDVGDGKMLMVALDALDAILKLPDSAERYCVLVDEAGGVDHLENLQEHENNEVYQKAVDIIERYFGTEEEDSENLAPPLPAADGNTFSFGVASTLEVSKPQQQQAFGGFGTPANVQNNNAGFTFNFE